MLDAARALPLWAVFVVSSAGFLAIYLGFGGATWLAITRLFPRLGWGRALPSLDAGPSEGPAPPAPWLRWAKPTSADAIPPAVVPGQIAREIRQSLVSIALFGGWSVVSVAAERAGWVAIGWDTNWDRVPLELVGLVLWNDLHFFAIHRLLHTRWLFKHIHREHHRALRPTPLSTYAMHPVEAAALGSVMFLVMPLVTLQLWTLLLFPVVSLALNNLGHMSYDLVPGRSDWHPLASSRRHALHHSRVAANYGFLLPVLDRLFGTDRLRKVVAREEVP